MKPIIDDWCFEQIHGDSRNRGQQLVVRSMRKNDDQIFGSVVHDNGKWVCQSCSEGFKTLSGAGNHVVACGKRK